MLIAHPARILLVEDDPDDVALFKSMLESAAGEVRQAVDQVDNADAAVASIRRQHYDLCFVDFELGADDGLALLRRMRDAGFGRPVVMLTGQGDEMLAVRAMKAGATDYLIKSALNPALLDATIRYVISVHQESERRRAVEAALRTSEARYRDLVNRVPVIVCELTADFETVFVSDAIAATTGFRPEELVGQPFWRSLIPDTVADQIPKIEAALRAGDIHGIESRVQARDGGIRTVEWSSSNRYRRDGALANVVLTGVDVTERVRLREELRAMAVRDDLTGLHNRRGFMTLAEQQLSLAAREKTPTLIIFIDMDGLKAINDRLGHDEGDRALVDLATVIRRTLRESDVIGRLGGDEFVALVPEAAPGRGDRVIRRLQDAIAAFNRDNQRQYLIAASAGVARYDPDRPQDIGQLLNRADTEMYEQKRQRRNRASVVREPDG